MARSHNINLISGKIFRTLAMHTSVYPEHFLYLPHAHLNQTQLTQNVKLMYGLGCGRACGQVSFATST